MGYEKQQQRKNQRNSATATVSRETANDDPITRLHDKARRLIESGDLEKALGMLNAQSSSDLIKNAKGVCLLRMEQFEAAVRVYRDLVLKHGCTFMRPELPVVYKTNFCTALLLERHPAGCEAALSEIKENDHPSVIRLREAISKWKSGLSLWQRSLYALGMEPDVRVTLEYVPGDFFGESSPE